MTNPKGKYRAPLSSTETTTTVPRAATTYQKKKHLYSLWAQTHEQKE